MKKSIQINRLPIISISSGEQIGTVKSLVINPDKGFVDFLTIEQEDFQVSVKAIPFKKVVGVGEYAVTVDSESAVIDLNEIPIANGLVSKNIKIINAKVMTRKGELIGEVSEYLVDQDTGRILGMEIKLPDREVVLSSEFIVTFGKEILIVKEDATSFFLSSAEELEQKEEKVSKDVEELLNHKEEIVSDEDIEDLLKREKDNIDDLLTAKVETVSIKDLEEITKQNENDTEEMLALKKKQIELLAGKKLKKNILDKNGHVLFRVGEILTSEQIELAQKEGPSIIVEISMNVEA